MVGALAALALGAACRSASERFSRRLSPLADCTAAGGRRRRIPPPGPVLTAPVGYRALHVYLDGDGTPEAGGYPTADPTPRDPLVLDLIALDGLPAVYVGRPCYHGLSTAACTPAMWTSARYSNPVVASMAAAVRRVVDESGVSPRVTWIGYSGGGVLAVLLATRVPQVGAGHDRGQPGHRRVERPPRHTAPECLTQPRAPAGAGAERPSAPLRRRSRHHLVPASITRQGTPPGAQLIVIPDYDHRCCWTTRWPSILAALEAPPPTR